MNAIRNSGLWGRMSSCARVANPRCLLRLAEAAEKPSHRLPHGRGSVTPPNRDRKGVGAPKIFATLCLLLPPLLQAQTEDPRALIQQAYAAQQAGDFAGAAAAYRAFLKLRPDEVGAHSNLGVVLVKLGRYDEAINEYQTAFRLAPDDTRIGVNLALALVKSGRVAEAAEGFETLHRRMPDDRQITLLLADSQLQLGNDDRVAQLLEPLARTDGSDLSIAYMLGMALLRKQRISEGQILLDRILGNGDTAEARFLLGTRMFETGDYPAAVGKLASAIELNPDLPGLESLYGRALLATGDPDGASAAFRKELVSNPNDFPANLALGQILLVRKQYEEAKPVLDRALSLRPKSADAAIACGELLAATNQLDQARIQFEAARQLAPDSLDLRRDLEAMYTRLHLGQDAAREHKEVERLETLLVAGATGPKPNDLAPDFSLPALDGGKTVTLSSFRGKSPVVLVFGSYSCPNFRGAAASLSQLEKRYGAKASFLLVYIREAHTAETWESGRNSREGVSVQPATNIQEKREHASYCMRQLHLAFPAVVDGMDGAAEKAYAAWPSLAVIVGKDGRVAYSTRLTELDYRAENMQAAIESVLAGTTARSQSLLRGTER
jgi:tetratricopeptide (TPR) repeat protein/thiol-disulfide isomerase/thioredoxin